MMDRESFAKIIAQLNDDQERAVTCDTNCVVTAGAGSGKTTVLSYRFLRLVVEGRANVDEILTLTFSRAAAAEMQERIHRTLHSYQEDPDIHAQMKRFSDATITTIDSFCNRIVASDPTRYGIGPDFVMDEDANREMATECAHRLFSQMEGHAGLEFLATIYSPDELIDSLFIGLAFNHFHPSSRFSGTEQAQSLTAFLQKSYREALSESLVIARKIIDLDGSGKTFEKDVAHLQNVVNQEDNLFELAFPDRCLSILDEVKVTKCTGKKEFVGLCNEYIDIFREQFRVTRIACAALCSEALVEPIYEVLESYHELYLASKRERGILTFGDIAHMARDILLNNRPVRTYFQRKYRYIMIDEFQDTNQLQRDLIYLIAQKPDSTVTGLPSATDLQFDKLFIVGDEKQSIYRFRGADVSVFKAVGEEIVQAGGKPINLPRNYRSEPALIHFFNSVFQQVMADAQESYEAKFETLETRKPIEGLHPSIGVFFKRLPDEDDSQQDGDENVLAVQAEAYTIAETIRKMVGGDDYLIGDQSGVRRPTYSDIAILFRTSSSQMHYEKALRLVGIPYTLSAVQSLFLEAPANDIYHLLQLLVFPDDRLAFAAALRSPLCRISDDALLLLLDTMKENSFEAFFDASVCNLTDEDRLKYDSCRTLFHQLQQLARGGSVATMVSHIWFEGGYRYYLLSDPLYQVYLEHFDFLHELAIQYDMAERGLPAFLDFVRPKLGQKQKLSDVEPLRDDTEGVQLMTVHKSKGLEFPIVILANMGGEPRGGASPAWIDIDGHIVPRHMKRHDKVTNFVYEQEKAKLKAMETAEMKRLFYVALTRAKTHLILSGCQNMKNLGASSKDKNFLALFFAATNLLEDPHSLGPACRLDDIPDAPLSVLTAAVSAKKIHLTVDRMDRFYQNPLPARQFIRTSFAVTEYAHEISPIEASKVLPAEFILPTVDADPLLIEHQAAATFGTWVHLLLQKSISSFTEGTPLPLVTEEEALGFIPMELARLDLGQQKLRLLTASVVLLANNFLSSQSLARLLRQKPISVESEVPFAMRWEDPEPIIVRGSIDLLVRYEDCIWVVDFKTDAFRRPEHHELQILLYRKAAERLYNLPVFTELYYLRDVEN